jgi:hypothetical protein
MPELTLLHIDQISRDINNQEISFSHLPDDLIDHVCCDVEYEMQQGLTFPEAYRRVKQKMGFRRLKEIQEETLYAVDTKYRNMKNTMKISGVAGTILLGFAALFKIQHWPFAGTMLTIGAVILAFVFMPSALGVIWKETHSRKRIFLLISAFLAGLFFIMGTLFKIQHWLFAGIMLLLAALLGIIFFIPALTISISKDQEKKIKRPVYFTGALGIIFYVAGLLFKIQHWPFATLLLMAGMILLCVVAFPWFTWITWRNDNHIRVRFIFILVGSLALVLPGVLINLNLSRSYEEGFYPHQEQQQALYLARYSSNLAILRQYRDSAAFQIMGQVHSRTTGLLNLIGNIQTDMVAESEGKPGVPALKPAQIIQTEMGPRIQYKSLSDPFEIGPVYHFLLPDCNSRLELNKAMSEYINFISGLTSGEQLLKYKALLNPSIFLPDESQNGTQISMMTGLLSTELLKNSILTVESSLLKSVARK